MAETMFQSEPEKKRGRSRPPALIVVGLVVVFGVLAVIFIGPRLFVRSPGEESRYDRLEQHRAAQRSEPASSTEAPSSTAEPGSSSAAATPPRHRQDRPLHR